MRFPAIAATFNYIGLARGSIGRTLSTVSKPSKKPNDSPKNESEKTELNKSVKSGALLAKSSKRTGMAQDDPLRTYFARFAGPPYNFVYNPTMIYSKEFNRLKKVLETFGWNFRRDDDMWKKERDLYSRAVNLGFEANMEMIGRQHLKDGLASPTTDSGKESDKGLNTKRGCAARHKRRELRILQAMCVVLRLDPIPATIGECHTEIRKINVNMVDFDHTMRQHGVAYTKNGVAVYKSFNIWDHVSRFETEKDLAKYTYPNRIYPLLDAHENSVMRNLLRHIKKHIHI